MKQKPGWLGYIGGLYYAVIYRDWLEYPIIYVFFSWLKGETGNGQRKMIHPQRNPGDEIFFVQHEIVFVLHPWKINGWNLKMDGLEDDFPF